MFLTEVRRQFSQIEAKIAVTDARNRTRFFLPEPCVACRLPPPSSPILLYRTLAKMKTVACLAAILGSAAAFAPAQEAKQTTALAAFENEREFSGLSSSQHMFGGWFASWANTSRSISPWFAWCRNMRGAHCGASLVKTFAAYCAFRYLIFNTLYSEIPSQT